MKVCQLSAVSQKAYKTELVQWLKSWSRGPKISFHSQLLQKLERYNITGSARVLKWFEDYLTHRRQRVRVNQSVSSWQDIPAGQISLRLLLTGPNSPLSSGTTIHVSPLEKAEVLNTAFARQCSAPTKTNSPLITPITPAEEFQFTPIDPETVYVALRKLNRWKASGVDGITNHLLKLCAKHIDVPLAHVFNLSLRSGRFPATWKQARVQPVFMQAEG